MSGPICQVLASPAFDFRKVNLTPFTPNLTPFTPDFRKVNLTPFP
jgi:hypothetical protein